MEPIKLFEIRDAATLIPVFAFRAARGDGDAERWLLRRAGYGPSNDSNCIIMGKLDCPVGSYSECTYDAYAHPNRTLREAHLHIERNWDKLKTGDVIDVEYVLGESTQPKQSERFDRFV